jgi:hypothetical protein
MAESAEARAHLDECASCRVRFNHTRVAHAVLGNLSDLGLDEVRQRAQGTRSSDSLAHPRFPVLPIGGFLLASTVLLAILVASPLVTDVRASELLDHAVSSERAQSQTQDYSLRVDGTPCATMRGEGHLAHVSRSSRCDNALAHIRDTVWAKGNPLSATTFRAWRRSLPHHHDALQHQSSRWVLKTSSNSGSVRFASLDLRDPDLRPAGLTIHFSDDAELSVSEDTAPADVAAERVPNLAPSAPTATAADHNPSADSNDLLEVRAWQTLSALRADSGWEATVVRTGSGVSIRAVTDKLERKEELQRGLAALAPAEVHIQTADDVRAPVDFLPQRSFPGAGEALAEAWVKEHFPAPTDETAFKNRVVRQSGALLGRALYIDRLKQRRAALSSCSCDVELSRLIVAEELALRSEQSTLLASLAPILDVAPSSAEKAMTAEEATRMDLIVQELLISSGDSTDSLQSHLSSLREIFGVPGNSSAPNTQNAALSR